VKIPGSAGRFLISANPSIKRVFSAKPEGTRKKIRKNCCPILTSLLSGSPLIQNDKLVGAVTHVLVNDPTRGYAVMIDAMLEEMEN